jgi:excisionase family DNA binding protein
VLARVVGEGAALATPQQPEQLLRFKDAALEFGVTATAIRKAVTAGKLRSLKVPGVRGARVKGSEVRAWIAAL